MPDNTTQNKDFGYLALTDPQLKEYGAKTHEPVLKGLARRCKDNPFVPIGLGVTVFALCYGMYQMKTGDKRMSQLMMRLRVAAQGFTVLALLGGINYKAYKEKKAKNENQNIN